MAALVQLRDVVKHFPVTRTLGEIARRQRPAVRAVDGVSFEVGEHESVAVVGESGCGKTTLGRLMLKLVEPTAGEMAFAGTPLAQLAGEGLRQFRRQAQLVFQNPFDALNPRFTIYRAVAEPLVNAGIDEAEHEERVAVALRRVHLPDLADPPPGCRFAPRCPFALAACTTEPVLIARNDTRNHVSACLRDGEADQLRIAALDPATWQRSSSYATS